MYDIFDVIPFIGDMLVDIFQFDVLGIKFGTMVVGFATMAILFFAVKKLF